MLCSVGDDDAFVASRHNITPNDAVRFIRLASGNHPTARVLWNPILALGSTFEVCTSLLGWLASIVLYCGVSDKGHLSIRDTLLSLKYSLSYIADIRF